MGKQSTIYKFFTQPKAYICHKIESTAVVKRHKSTNDKSNTFPPEFIHVPTSQFNVGSEIGGKLLLQTPAGS